MNLITIKQNSIKRLVLLLCALSSNISFGQVNNKIDSLFLEISKNIKNTKDIYKNKFVVEISTYKKNAVEKLIQKFYDSTKTKIYSNCLKRNINQGELAIILVDIIEPIPFSKILNYKINAEKGAKKTDCETVSELYFNSIKNEGDDMKGFKKIYRELYNENTVIGIAPEDTEMEAAIEMAKKTFGDFETAIKSNNPNFKNFTLKKPYESDEGDEHIWIRSVMFYPKKNNYIGIIAAPPLHTKKVKNDEIVEIDKNEISDWMYFDNTILKGGYTIRLLRSRMTAKEKKAFDNESGYIFD